jgi:hypothetical protein
MAGWRTSCSLENILRLAVLSRKNLPASGSGPSQRSQRAAKAQKVAAGKNQKVLPHRAHAVNDSISPHFYVFSCFASWASI